MKQDYNQNKSKSTFAEPGTYVTLYLRLMWRSVMTALKFVRVFKLRYNFMATRERINEYVCLSKYSETSFFLLRKTSKKLKVKLKS